MPESPSSLGGVANSSPATSTQLKKKGNGSSKRLSLFSRFASQEQPTKDDDVVDLSKLKKDSKKMLRKRRMTSKSTLQTAVSNSSFDSHDEDDLTASFSSDQYCMGCSESGVEIEASLTKKGIIMSVTCNCYTESREDSQELIDATTSKNISHIICLAAELSAQGNYEASRQHYQRALQQKPTAHVCANLCYTAGLLSTKLQDYQAAAYYYQQELEHTKQYTQQCKIDPLVRELAVSKCYHGLARLYQYDMGESDKALPYYQQALQVEEDAFEKVSQSTCAECKPRKKKVLCQHIKTQLRELHAQIQQTKQCIGRIHFQNGNVDHALRLTIHGKR